MEVRFCTTSDGIRIAYATYGSGPPLVWVPGWISHVELDWPVFGPTIEAWADEYTVVRYDKRGTGLSDRDQPDLSIQARLRDLEAVVDALKLKRFALLGASEGGPIAIAYAAKYPRRVSHLVIHGSYARGGFTPPDVMHALQSLIRVEWGLATSSFTSVLLPDASAEQIKAFAKLQLEGASVDDALALFDEIQRIDVRPLLPTITAPTLVIHGKQDRAVPFPIARELAGAIPNARLVSYDGGHLPLYPSETGKFIHATIRDFLHETSRRGRTRKAPAKRAPVESGVRTVLFTDLVGHTEMMSRLGDERGRAVLREHERITRDVLKQHGGDEVKTMGDGFMASFGSVTQAMQCAISLQRAFDEWNASDQAREMAPLDVRVGLNAGEPIAEDGDLFGSTVILAARVAAQAGAGEILVPEPVRHLLSGKDFLFADRGEFLPKGFEDRVRLFEVRWRA